MALIKTLTAYELQEKFRDADRDYFSIEGYQAILDLFNEDEFDTELDVIAINCDFTEADPEEIYDNYNNIDEIADCKDEDGDLDVTRLMKALNYRTWATELNNGNILYQNF